MKQVVLTKIAKDNQARELSCDETERNNGLFGTCRALHTAVTLALVMATGFPSISYSRPSDLVIGGYWFSYNRDAGGFRVGMLRSEETTWSYQFSYYTADRPNLLIAPSYEQEKLEDDKIIEEGEGEETGTEKTVVTLWASLAADGGEGTI